MQKLKLAAIILIGFVLPTTVSAENSSKDLTVEALIASSITGIESHQALVSKVHIPAHTTLSRHHHPTEEYLYIMSGSTILQMDGEEDKELTAGMAMIIPAGKIHAALTKKDSTDALVFRVQPKDQPVRLPPED